MHHHKKRFILISLTFLITIFLVSSHATNASAPAGFATQYGLTVHNENRDDAVPESKGMEVLNNFFFPGSKLSLDTSAPVSFITQREFLINFAKLRLASEGKISDVTDDELYSRIWLEARRNNWLPKAQLTYDTMQEFIYRYLVSQAHEGRPYLDGLVLNKDEIDQERFQSADGVRKVKDELLSQVLNINTLSRLSISDRQYLAQVAEYYQAFRQLETQLEVDEHPLRKIPNMPEDIRNAIIDNDLDEVLQTISYDYSSNKDYRRHNLTTAVLEMSGRIFQPDEEINFIDILADGGWDKYEYGWVIVGGEDQWAFGGGICGGASMVFESAWRAGLESVTRYPHSVFYSNYYPNIGLDAAIYRNSKNLVLKNSTGSPILYYVDDDEENETITLYMIGKALDYDMEIEGPIETGEKSYKWIRRMVDFDGKVVEEELMSKYALLR